jgi:hypothetical protein
VEYLSNKWENEKIEYIDELTQSKKEEDNKLAE